jgi:plastocyanin
MTILKNSKIIFLVLALIILPALLTGCGPKSASQTANQPQQPANNNNQPANQPANHLISLKNFAFNPDTLTIKTGEVVTWRNDDTAPHQIVSDPHPAHTDLPGLKSMILQPGQVFSYTFLSPGSYGYHCEIHLAMEGRIIVE